MLEIITIALGLALIVLASGNSVGVSVGNLIASRIVTKRTAMVIVVVGFVSGFILEGNLMQKTASAFFVGPSVPPFYLLIPICIFAISFLKKIPQSLSISITTALFGTNLALGNLSTIPKMYSIVSFWILVPIASFALSIILLRALKRLLRNKFSWSLVMLMKILMILASFFMSFVIGSNIIGFIYALLPPNPYLPLLIVASIVIGCLAFSGRVLKRISNEIIPMRYINTISSQAVLISLIEFSTLFGIPISNTETFIGGIYGSGVGYKNRLIAKRPIKTILLFWISTAFVCFMLGYFSAFVMA
ncbi:MAG: inorganic phosphate transporter [Candidatus Micrarchaeales archaeon]